MKALELTYLVVLHGDDGKIVLVYKGTFNQVLKKAKFACPEGYYIREIKVA